MTQTRHDGDTMTSSPPTSAHVHFRARCPSVGYGEEVYLCLAGDNAPQWRMPLHTTASRYPWFRAAKPVNVKLSPNNAENLFKYRYRIYRGGVPHRWEGEDPNEKTNKEIGTTGTKGSSSQVHGLQKSISSSISMNFTKSRGHLTRLESEDDGSCFSDDCPTNTRQEIISQDARRKAVNPGQKSEIASESIHMEEKESELAAGDLQESDDDENDGNEECNYRYIRLDLLECGQEYIVRDILGENKESVPDLLQSQNGRRSSVSTLHAQGALQRRSPDDCDSNADCPTRKKTVCFTEPDPPKPPKVKINRPRHQQQQVRPIVLDSNDGLIVVSAFLPILLDFDSTTGIWSAAWDDEVLLSMQTTHLRVTRVGSVRWGDGVPVSERSKVEACVRELDCVPVWIDAGLFRDMYNGFCKGVLWPVMHNLTSVYTSMPRVRSVELEGSNYQNGRDHVDEIGDNRALEPNETAIDSEQASIHGRQRQKELWKSYQLVNLKFAEVVAEYYQIGDLVWVHGFHLMVLPSFIRRRIPLAKVGIFLHTPFPSSEIFRTTWFRDDLLRGMLNADQVGFHLFEYARHFLTCCRRLLGLNYDMTPNSAGGSTLAIDVNGRHVAVTNIHAGIEPRILYKTLSHKSTRAQAARIRAQYPGKTIFCSVDRLESLKGIPLKMLGVKRFLSKCPQWIGKIVLIQIGISAFERGDDYIQTKRDVNDIVRNVNAIWPGTIYFEERSIPAMKLCDRMALMQAADVVLTTPVRDGLNLVPLEYALAHSGAFSEAGRRDKRKRGICILSEFSSCARVMRGALQVNPWMVSEIAMAFYQALTMSDEERLRRLSIAVEYVRRVTTERWAHAVLLDLKGVPRCENAAQFSGAGLGGGYRQITMESSFDSLNFSLVLSSFKRARSRLILLDYGGTIVSNDNLDKITRFQMVRDQQSHSVPSDEMMLSIEELCMDKRNTVFVVSGKERHSLLDVFGHIPHLGLAAEHGMYITWPTGNTAVRRRWEQLVSITDQAWRSIAMAIMEVYKSRTSGSYMEETEMKVLWQYRDADPEFGYWQAKELEDNLSKYLREYPVDILHGGLKEGGYVEVRPKGVNKGVLAMKIMKHFPEISQKDKLDFALVLGDDHCDEPMLSVMRQIGHRSNELSGIPLSPLDILPSSISRVDVSPCDKFTSPGTTSIFTCTVGKKPSAAEHYLHDVEEVLELLNALVKVSSRDRRRCHSSVELRRSSSQILDALEYEYQPRRSASCGEIEVTAAQSSKRRSASPEFLQFLEGIIPGAAEQQDDEPTENSWAAHMNGGNQDWDSGSDAPSF